MLDPDALAARLDGRKLPPVEQWHPALCGDIDIRIARDGTWYHDGAPIRRRALCRLLSTVLRRDEDGEYYLVTPVEKLRIRVDDAPFRAVLLDVQGEGKNQQLHFTTDCDDLVCAGREHPLHVHLDPDSGEPAPYVHVRQRLFALLARPVYYQLAELVVAHAGRLGVWSAGVHFALDGAADRAAGA